MIWNRRQHIHTHTDSLQPPIKSWSVCYFFLFFFPSLFTFDCFTCLGRRRERTVQHIYNRSPKYTGTCIQSHWHWNVFSCVHEFYLHLDLVCAFVFSLFFSPSSSIDTEEILLVRAIWFRCSSAFGSAIDLATVLLSVSSWSWVSWEHSVVLSCIYVVYTKYWFSQRNQRKCVCCGQQNIVNFFFLIKTVLWTNNTVAKVRNKREKKIILSFIVFATFLLFTTRRNIQKKKEKKKQQHIDPQGKHTATELFQFKRKK